MANSATSVVHTPAKATQELNHPHLELLITLVAALFFIGVAPAIIRYAAAPVGRMVQMTGTCSVSLGLLVSSGIGVGCALLFTIQVCRGIPRQSAQQIARQLVHPGCGRSNTEPLSKKWEDTFLDLNKWLRSQKEFPGLQNEDIANTSMTRDRVQLYHYWYQAHDVTQAPTILLFNGNNACSIALISLVQAYKRWGCNVCITEYRGYGLSEGKFGGPNQEVEAYLDAEAALSFVLDKGVPKEHVVAHGFSLGGAYACALARFYGVQHLILDHTFTSAGAVASHFLGGIFSRTTLESFMQSSYQQIPYPAHTTILDAQEIQPDGFNNLQKVKDTTGNLLVIQGESDAMMPTEFGDMLIQARQNDSDYTHDLLKLSDSNGGQHSVDYNKAIHDPPVYQALWKLLANVNKTWGLQPI